MTREGRDVTMATTDLLLGSDFQQMHEKVIFRYDGSKVKLVPKPDAGICSTVASRVKPVSLFSNLLPGCHPIATKSRRIFNFFFFCCCL